MPTQTTESKAVEMLKIKTDDGVIPERCSSHKIENRSYLVDFEYSEKQHKAGIIQEQCPVCLKWIWPFQHLTDYQTNLQTNKLK